MPQQKAMPSVVMPQVKRPPELTWLNWSGAVAAATTGPEPEGDRAVSAGPVRDGSSSPQARTADARIATSRAVVERGERRMVEPSCLSGRPEPSNTQ